MSKLWLYKYVHSLFLFVHVHPLYEEILCFNIDFENKSNKLFFLVVYRTR